MTVSIFDKINLEGLL